MSLMICKGTYYRYIESQYKGAKGQLVLTQELRVLKSLSCPGCASCLRQSTEVTSAAQQVGRKAFLFADDLRPGDTVVLTREACSEEHPVFRVAKRTS